MEKQIELVKIDKNYVFKEISDIYDMVDGELCESIDEILERIANLQAYCKEGE